MPTHPRYLGVNLSCLPRTQRGVANKGLIFDTVSQMACLRHGLNIGRLRQDTTYLLEHWAVLAER